MTRKNYREIGEYIQINWACKKVTSQVKLQPILRISKNKYGQLSKYDKQKQQNYREIADYIQNIWASKQVTSNNYKTTAILLRKTTVNSTHISKILGQVKK